MKVGYARVSTDEQNLDPQLDALRSAACDVIYQDQGISGVAADRPGLGDAIARLQAGDVLVIWKLDRLGRSLAHLIALTAQLESKGVTLVSLSEAIDTRSPSGRLLFHVMGALAEFERSLIAERTRAGIAAARERGIKIGRPPKLSVAEVEQASALLAAGRSSLKDLATDLQVSPATLSRAVVRHAWLKDRHGLSLIPSTASQLMAPL